MKTIEQMYNEAKALVEDRTYNIGEISEKTGLQKTANGWVKPSETNFGKVKQNKNGEWGVQTKQGKNSPFIKHKNESEAKNALVNYTKGYNSVVKTKQDPHSEKARQIKHWNKETKKIMKENKAQRRAERAAQFRNDKNLKNQKKTEKEEKSKWEKTTDYLGRDRISLKTKQGGLVSIYETDNPNQKNNRFRVDTGTHTNTFNTMEEAKAFAEKHYGDTKENGPKGDVDRFVKNNKSMWQKNIEKAPDARLKELAAKSEKGNAAEKEVAKMAKEELAKRTSSTKAENPYALSKEEKNEAMKNPKTRLSQKYDEVIKSKKGTPQYNTALEEYTKEREIFKNSQGVEALKGFPVVPISKDSACRITADTKIKLKNVVEDRKYQIGEISEKTGLQKTANGWVKPKKGTSTKKEESKKETAEIKYTGEWKTDAEKFDPEAQEGIKELAAMTGKSEEEIYQIMKVFVPGMPKERQKEEENKNTFVKFDKNPISADVGDWAFSSYEDGSTEEELAGFIYEAIEMDANVDIGEVLHNLDLHVENFDKDNQKKWEKVKNDFIKRFKPKQTHNPMSTKNKKEEQKEQKPKKDYGKATGAAKKVIDMIDDLEVPYKDFFLECLQKGLSVDDALDELRSKKVAYYAGSKFDPKKEKVNQFYDLQDTLKNKGLRTVVPLNWGFWE